VCQLDAGYRLDLIDSVQVVAHGHNTGDDEIEIRGVSMIRDGYRPDTYGLGPTNQLGGNQDAIAEN
jgi:hypothetical protein